MNTYKIHEGPGRWYGQYYENAFWVIINDGRESWDFGPCDTHEEAELVIKELEAEND